MRKLSTDGLEVKNVTIDDGDLLRLFVYSLAWRGAVVKINTFEMKPDHQEILRTLLLKCLGENLTALQSNIKDNASEIRAIQAIINFFEVKDTNDNPINCSISYRPYSMQLNDLGFQLYFEDAPAGDDDQLFQEINSIINGRTYLMQNEEKFHVALISDKKRQQLNINLYTRKGIETMRKSTLKFIKGFIYLFGLQPGPQEIALFQNNLIKRAQTKIEGYTDDDQFSAAQEAIMELFPWLYQEK